MRTFFSKLARSVASTVSSAAVSSAASSVSVSANEVESLEDRKLFSSTLAYGINANQISSATYPKIEQMMRDMGTKTARLWVSVSNYSHTETGIFKVIRAFHNDGFDVMASVVPSSTSASPETVKSYFDWISNDLGDSVNRWQVGNEVDVHWGTSSTSLGKYVDNLLKPAYEALHANGEKVVSGSVSWNPDDIKTLVGQGMLNYCDFVGYHPYAKSIGQLESNVAAVKDYANGKPLVASEWNARGHEGNMSDWNDAIKESWPTIRDNFYAAYYFAAIKTGSMAGPGGVLNSSGTGANGEFYSTFKGLGGGGGSTPVTPVTPPVVKPVTPPPVTPPTPPTIPPSSTTGNTPSGTSKPAIGGFAIYDGITNRVLKGYENVTAGQTIKLSSLAHRQIQIRAITTSSTGSVRFGFTGRAARNENVAPYTAFANTKGVESPWYASAGAYTLTATAYTADNAAGTVGNTLSLVLKFI